MHALTEHIPSKVTKCKYTTKRIQLFECNLNHAIRSRSRSFTLVASRVAENNRWVFFLFSFKVVPFNSVNSLMLARTIFCRIRFKDCFNLLFAWLTPTSGECYCQTFSPFDKPYGTVNINLLLYWQTLFSYWQTLFSYWQTFSLKLCQHVKLVLILVWSDMSCT